MTAYINLFAWTIWPAEVQHLASVGVFWACWLITGVAVGYTIAYRQAERALRKTVKNILEHVRSDMARDNDDWEKAETFSLSMTPAIFDACHKLDVEAMRVEIARQSKQDLDSLPPADALLPTMHMMRAGHAKFSTAEKEWSEAWLVKNGFAAQGEGEHRTWGGTVEGKAKDPTIN